MSKLGIVDDVTEKVKDLLTVRMQEAKEAVAKIDAMVEARKATLEGDLKKIEEEVLGRV